MEKLGLFLCSGCGIGDALDFDAIEEAADEAGAKTTVTHECLCAAEGVEAICSAVNDESLDGILIGACSDRAKAGVFDRLEVGSAGVYRISLREQTTWSHEAGDEDTQMLAEDLVRMGLARLDKMKTLTPLEETIDDTVLVVGGGRAGLEAAKTAAGLGHPVVLVERNS
jgi:quinone-modifying oxidoreductase subunit QmoB